jgi:hypothetical protein
MSDIRFPEQRHELQRLLKESHLGYAQIAERVAIKVETVEKYVEGWQQAGKKTTALIRQVCERENERLKNAAGKKGHEGKLHADVVEYAGKLLELPEGKRQLAKALIDELSGEPTAKKSLAEVKKEAAEAYEKDYSGLARKRLVKGERTPGDHERGSRNPPETKRESTS